MSRGRYFVEMLFLYGGSVGILWFCMVIGYWAGETAGFVMGILAGVICVFIFAGWRGKSVG